MRYPAGVRTIAWATAIRYLGWGLVDALIPIFLYQFSGSYIQTALLTSAFYLFFLISVPLAGVLADRLSARTILMASLSVYFIVGLSYYFAGTSGLIAGLILARATNGIALSLDTLGRYTYIRIHVAKEHIGRTFGYVNSISNFWYMVMLVLSLFVVNIIPVQLLFLSITFSALVAFVLIKMRLAPDRKDAHIKGMAVFSAYKDMYHRMRLRGVGLWTLAFLAFSIGFFSAINVFLVPLYIYKHDDSLRQVIFFTGLITLPAIFSRYIGSLVDMLHRKAIFIGFTSLIIIFAIIPFLSYAAQLAGIVIVAAFLQLIALAHITIVTHRVHAERYGRVEGIMQVASLSGVIICAFVIGLINQLIGNTHPERAFFFLAAAATVALFVLYARKRYLSSTIWYHEEHSHH